MKCCKIDFSSKAITKLLLKITYLSVIGLFLLDFYFYFGFVRKNLVSPLLIGLFLIIIHAVISLRARQKLSPEFVRFNIYILAPLSILLTLAAFYLEESRMLFPNYFFTNFKFHYLALPFLSLPAVSFGLIHASRAFLKANWKYLVVLYSILAVGLASFIYYFDSSLYFSLASEDGIVEYLSAVAFFGSGILAFIFLRKRKIFPNFLVQKIFIAGCLFVGATLLIIAGEEISWGQRILNIETPEYIAAQNRQGEINLHNTEMLWPYVYSGYLAVGLYGSLMWIVVWLSQDMIVLSKTLEIWKKILIPRGFLCLHFGIIALYVYLRMMHGYWKYQPWEEISELFLAAGIFIHLLETYIDFPKKV